MKILNDIFIFKIHLVTLQTPMATAGPGSIVYHGMLVESSQEKPEQTHEENAPCEENRSQIQTAIIRAIATIMQTRKIKERTKKDAYNHIPEAFFLYRKAYEQGRKACIQLLYLSHKLNINNDHLSMSDFQVRDLLLTDLDIKALPESPDFDKIPIVVKQRFEMMGIPYLNDQNTQQMLDKFKTQTEKNQLDENLLTVPLPSFGL